jgi:hypothetical protein
VHREACLLLLLYLFYDKLNREQAAVLRLTWRCLLAGGCRIICQFGIAAPRTAL